MVLEILAALTLIGLQDNTASRVEFSAAYEMLPPRDGSTMMFFFEEASGNIWISRRDPLSISEGGTEGLKPCDYGAYCIEIFDEGLPIVIDEYPGDLEQDGFTLTKRPVEIPHAAPCVGDLPLSFHPAAT